MTTPVPTPTPTPAPVKAIVKSVKVSPGKTTKLTYSLSAGSKVTLTLTRTDCKRGKGCASASNRWSETTDTGTRTFALSRDGRPDAVPPAATRSRSRPRRARAR